MTACCNIAASFLSFCQRCPLDNESAFHKIVARVKTDSFVASASVFLLADYFMAQRRFDIAFSHGFAARGLALAEQRLAYLTELFDTGRWRRFHSEEDFLMNVRESRAAVDAWRRIEQFNPAAKSPRPLVTVANVPLMPPEPPAAPEDAAEAISLLQSFAGPTDATQSDSPPRRPSLLPPVLFSTDGVAAERDLSDA